MSKHALAIMFAISASLAVPAARAAASDYIPLEYIYMEGGASAGQQDDTATHYINTGVVPSGGWTIRAEFASTNSTADNAVYSVLFCARHNGTSNNIDSFLFWPHIGSQGWHGYARIDIAGKNTHSGQWINDMQRNAISQCVRHTVEIKPSSSGKSAGYFDGTRITEEFTQSASSVCPLYLFSAYTGASDGTVSSVKFSFEGWFYGLKASDGDGKLQLDLVPAKRASDGVVGVYDAANDTFYTNGNANYAFAAGPATGLGVASVSKVSGSYVPVVTNGFAGVATAGTDYTFAVTANAVGMKTMTVTGNGTYAGVVGSVLFQSLLNPAEYIELEGISMTGASYIIPQSGGADIYPGGGWSVSMGFAPAQKTGDYADYSCLLSARDTSTGDTFMIWNFAVFNTVNNRLGRFDYTGNTNLAATANTGYAATGRAQGTGAFHYADAQDAYGDIALSAAYGTDYVFSISNGVQAIDGETVSDASDYTGFTAGGRLTVFTSSTGSTANANHAAVGTFRFLAMADANGSPVLKMIPAKRVSDGVAGVYDVVNRTFYQSAGTGAFSVGTEVLIPEQSSGLLIFVR